MYMPEIITTPAGRAFYGSIIGLIVLVLVAMGATENVL